MSTPTGDIILVVDDEQDVREVVASCLQKAGYDTVLTENGRAAYEVLEQRFKELGDVRVAAIVSDWMMPEVNGVELLQRVRGGEFKTLPFVLMSGAVTREDLVLALRIGADSIVLKPFTTDMLIKKVQEAMNVRLQKELQNM